jgi:hypothetical protein
MATKRVAVRQSELGNYELCGEYSRLKDVEHLEALPGLSAHRGTGVHGGAHANYRQKIKSGRDLPKKDMVDAAVAAFEEKKAQEGFRLTPDERGIGASTMIARTVNTVVVMTGAFADKLAPQVQPLYTELKITAEIPGTNIDLQGTIDVVDTSHGIEDLKTSTRAKSQQEADGSNQFSQYGLLYHAKTGIWPNPFYLDTIVDYKKGPDLVRRPTQRNAKDYAVYVERMNEMLKARAAGIFHPAPVGHWFCSSKWCPFFEGRCRFVNSERMSASESQD